LNGVTYHPQDEAFFSWFAHQSPSIGAGGRYSYVSPSKLTSPPPSCTWLTGSPWIAHSGYDEAAWVCLHTDCRWTGTCGLWWIGPWNVQEVSNAAALIRLLSAPSITQKYCQKY